jgi:hypothetical protein
LAGTIPGYIGAGLEPKSGTLGAGLAELPTSFGGTGLAAEYEGFDCLHRGARAGVGLVAGVGMWGYGVQGCTE